MNEFFLHYVWKYKLFDPLNLKTSSGEPIEIIKAGEHNHHDGPDFTEAQVKIGQTLWVGNIEIHVNSKDWNTHRHDLNKNYNNVILHVVYQFEGGIKNEAGTAIPTLELKHRVFPHVQRNYEFLSKSKASLPCFGQLKEIPPLLISLWQERLIIERLEEKVKTIQLTFEATQHNLEETFYRHLAANFGFKANKQPFFQLAESLPLAVLNKYQAHLFQLEALLLGQAGMLEDFFEDKYMKDLQNEYSYLQKKHQLIAMRGLQWKFMRLRPMNFPTIRIAQFASLIHAQYPLFAKIMNCRNTESIYHLFDISVSAYWTQHFVPGKKSAELSKNLGKEAIHNIISNTICPVLFFYGRLKDDQQYIDLAVQLLSEIPEENNKITKIFDSSALCPSNSLESQAAIQLYNNYCMQKRCHNCSIGNHIIQHIRTPQAASNYAFINEGR